jgi:pSer/pThr/pTyr-binding forkhead associated (FHA) protein
MSAAKLMRVGRAVDNELVLTTPFISDYHLEIFQDPQGNVFMTDLKSANGTFVNGSRLIGFILLKAGDEVFLGTGYKLEWEELLAGNIATNKEKENTAERQKMTGIDASDREEPFISATKESAVDRKSFLRDHADIIIIYGLIISFVIYFYWKVN